MPPQVALVACIAFIIWLLIQDHKRREVSAALWIPLAWLLVMSSKLSSVLLGGSATVTAEGYVEGSLFDRLAYFVLIAAGWFVLSRRGVSWGTFYRQNKWICLLFLYAMLSVLWSDYPLTSFKRWIKDAGNIVMALVVLTERDPLDAVKALLSRCAFILIPLSVLFVKYYPQLGRYYDPWTGQAFDCAVMTDKNCFGMMMFFLCVGLFWMVMESQRAAGGTKGGKGEWYTLLILFGLTAWLLKKAQSSTALSCALLACAILFGLRFQAFRSKVRFLGIYCVSLVFLVLLLHVALDLGGGLVGLLGRDLTLTGRTTIWRVVLSEDVNPLIGVGYYSFWLGERVERLSDMFFYHLNQAHNGYIETYLNTGLIGLFLLLMVLISAAGSIKAEVISGSSLGPLRLAFLLATAVYGMTEAIFRFGPIWFVLLLLLIDTSWIRKRWQ